jgi:predicted permease
MIIIWQDLRYALRLARKNPGFTMIAVLSLAIGIAAVTVLFTIVYGVLLRPLPYSQPDRLVRLLGMAGAATMPELEFWKQHATVYESVAGYRYGGDRTLVVGGESQQLSTLAITSDFFRTLGVALPIGREFSTEETGRGGLDAIILTHGLFKTAFASDRDVVGKTMVLGRSAYIVVGVLPADFWFPQKIDAVVPLRLTGGATDTGSNTETVGRLKGGISIGEATAENAALADAFRRGNPLPYPLDPGYAGLRPVFFQYWLTGDVRLVLMVVFAACGILLLMACSNLASLILARLAAREKEVAVRLALGSSRSRLSRQFLTENLTVAACGGVCGFLFASWLLPLLPARIPFQLPAAAPIRVDLPVLLFAFGVVLLVGVLLSLAPSFASSRFDITEGLQRRGRMAGAARTQQLMHGALVTGQIALSLVLLISAMLLSRSLYRLTHQDLGFNPDSVITFDLTAPSSTSNDQAKIDLRSLQQALLDRFRSLPGVQDIAGINVLPLSGQNNYPTQRYGHPEQSIGGMEIRIVTPRYFETMGIALLSGRGFTADDNTGAPPVIAVNETVARRWWPNGNPLGDLVAIGLFQGRPIPAGSTPASPRVVVGVVGDTKSVDIKAPPRPTVYIPYSQASSADGPNWLIRGRLPNMFVEQLRAAAAQVDPRLRVQRLRPVEDVVIATTAVERFNALLFGSFAGTAVLVASIGIFGLLSFSVIQRTREIGTRLALGASRAQILTLILKQELVMLASGLALGVGGALGLTRFLSRLLFGIEANDAVSYGAASLLLLLVGILAGYLPARQAMKVDPITALRSE